jgi:hypothetical protein
MPEINLVDSNIKKNADDKELSVQISQNSFTYCINSVKEKNVLAFRSYKFTNAVLFEDVLGQTESILEQDSLLSIPFSKTRFLYICRKSTLVPDEFFEPELIKRFIDFNQPIDDLDELHFNNIYRIKSKLVFAIPTYLAAHIIEKFKNVEFYNQAMPLIDILGGLSNKSESFQIIINLNKEFFDVVIYQQSKLRLSNSFLYSNSTDLVYFILFVCKQLNIDLSSSIFYMLGECSTMPDLVSELSGFIRNIKKPEIFQDLSTSIKLKNDFLMQYATLFKLM